MNRLITFNEIHILLFNLVKSKEQGREAFLLHLDELYANTEDTYLKAEIFSLREKIETLTQAEFSALCQDTVNGTILMPPAYKLPCIFP